MKLIYTGIRNPMTPLLVKEAQALVDAGKRVFYIAPNSLSFEKERAVLETLPNHASFDITVTRFGQMARYLILNDYKEVGESIDDIGLGMMLFKVLNQMDPKELQVYRHLTKDTSFIQDLIAIYKDLLHANMTIEDLSLLEGERKVEDLQKIFTALQAELNLQGRMIGNRLKDMMSWMEEHPELDLTQTAVVIDGYTRFSAEELSLIELFHRRGVEIVIGAYATKQAFYSGFLEGNVYQASVLFLRDLQKRFSVQAHYVEGGQKDFFAALSQKFEDAHSFQDHSAIQLPKDQDFLILSSLGNQKQELEWVAADIRRKLQAGVRYKDIRVLLGDVDAYQLQLQTIFKQYQIPFYLGRSEAMAFHPLVHWIESIERLKRYNFRADDVLNLIKTGLFGNFTSQEIDALDQYVRFADLKGQAAFARPFKANRENRFDLEALNQTRAAFIAPLQDFFKARTQSVSSLLKKWTVLMTETSLPQRMAALAQDLPLAEQEQFQEVWKAYTHILEELQSLFGKEKLSVDDFLALIRSGMLLSTYRTVPATVDVVRVQSYDLVQPMSSPIVYALGMTQGNFPKPVTNRSLLQDAERQLLNERTGNQASLPIFEGESLMRNHYLALSLFNAADSQLVLTYPELLNDSETVKSPYLSELQQFGLPLSSLGKSPEETIGTYQSLLSRVIEQHQGDIDREWSKEEATFWSVAIRVLRKHLSEDGIVLPDILGRPKSQPLSQETLDALFPSDKPLYISASKLTTFYRNQYLFFIESVLKLQENLSIHPDARMHGSYLHAIFESYLKKSGLGLQEAIRLADQDALFAQVYGEDAESRLTKEQLVEIARATAPMLKNEELYQTIEEEQKFGNPAQPDFYLPDGRPVVITGFIDRVDQLKENGAVGVVDYKSSDQKFQLKKFYYGLNSQLPTYMQALQKGGHEQVFGAMYLHMQDPIVKAKEVKEGNVLGPAMNALAYKGLFAEESSKSLATGYKKESLSAEGMATILAFNQALYEEAARGILSGSYAINPTTLDRKSVDPYANAHTAITGFEANFHMDQARFLDPMGIASRGKKATQGWLEVMKGGGKHDEGTHD